MSPLFIKFERDSSVARGDYKEKVSDFCLGLLRTSLGCKYIKVLDCKALGEQERTHPNYIVEKHKQNLLKRVVAIFLTIILFPITLIGYAAYQFSVSHKEMTEGYRFQINEAKNKKRSLNQPILKKTQHLAGLDLKCSSLPDGTAISQIYASIKSHRAYEYNEEQSFFSMPEDMHVNILNLLNHPRDLDNLSLVSRSLDALITKKNMKSILEIRYIKKCINVAWFFENRLHEITFEQYLGWHHLIKSQAKDEARRGNRFYFDSAKWRKKIEEFKDERTLNLSPVASECHKDLIKALAELKRVPVQSGNPNSEMLINVLYTKDNSFAESCLEEAKIYQLEDHS